MSHQVKVYRQIDALQAKAEQLPFVSALQVCLEFGAIEDALRLPLLAHNRAVQGLADTRATHFHSPQLKSLVEQAWKAVIIHSRAFMEAEKARSRLAPVWAKERFVRSMRQGLHIGAAGSRAA